MINSVYTLTTRWVKSVNSKRHMNNIPILWNEGEVSWDIPSDEPYISLSLNVTEKGIQYM